eukprot:GHVR01129028.1.p1 GENE.GHVR01129028.1~~GHVR01129028.1.p1  ORF type:complete len:308 (+),score=105.24 GHVR01129028.1:27-950(+)
MVFSASACTSEFIKEALRDNLRVDSRDPQSFRPISFKFGDTYGHVTVKVGDTTVMCVVSGVCVAPSDDRPSEGTVTFNVELNPTGTPVIDSSRQNEMCVGMCCLLENVFRKGGAVDVESLCVSKGEKAWSIRVDVRVEDQCGNPHDAVCLSALAALKHFKRQDTEFKGTNAVQLSEDLRAPTPLCIHHNPFVVSFVMIDGTLVVDPSLEEEELMESRISISMDKHGVVCGIHKSGGVSLSFDAIDECINYAAIHVRSLSDTLEDALRRDAKDRETDRRRIVGCPDIVVHNTHTHTHTHSCTHTHTWR